MFNLFKQLSSNIPPNPPFRKGENEWPLFERGRRLKEYFGLSHAMVIALVLFIAISIFGAVAGRPPKRRQLTKAPLLWAKLDGSLADENGSGSTFAYSPGKPSTASGISLKEGDNIQYGPGAAIDAGSDVYENWNPNQGTMNVWVEPSWAGNDNEAHWIWSADAGRIDTADANLQAYFKFDEGSENFAFDSSANSNVGYLHGPALSFDGDNDIVNISLLADYHFTGGGTLECWLYINNVAETGKYILSTGNAEASGWLLKTRSGPVLEFQQDATTSGTWRDQISYTLVSGAWMHLVFYYNSSNPNTDPVVYINGNSKTIVENETGVGSANNGTTGFKIGNTASALNGQIDELRIYNRALSATEVGQHYVGNFANESGLVGYWNMDENQGQTVADSSGNSNNGTLGATSGSSTDDPTWVNYAPRWTEEGRFGDAVVFDGSDDELEINDINF